MITEKNLPELLTLLGFTSDTTGIWSKSFNDHTQLQVDFNTQTLIYPDTLIVNERQTCNFSQNENFVVFECVHRLLEKGYQPQHIELEKRWTLGHTQKSGRADICVYTNDDKPKMLFIIECKTYGTEYNKALKILKEDGGQLFSYWQQDRSIDWVSLYASDFTNNQLIYKNDIIRCLDDTNLIQVAKKDDSIKLYKNAKNTEQLHQIWQETYLGQLYEHLIFGNDSTAYKIGIAPLRKKDLKEFSPNDKIINQFEEILRHNAVSDKENAFNRLIALFICKLVDEINKDERSEVDFQYKVGQDTFEILQDRLQKLYKDGMEKFMQEEIFYVANDYAEDIFSRYQGKDRKNAIDELKTTIRNLKFFTNNDFAFKDVHNEELFLQNGKILVEMVQLFEKYRIVYSSKHQFLGDLFEQLLNKGFKQNEGQFFTPSPITRFIWDCLPLQEIIKNNNDEYPKVIDYACGSGHFLTEAVEAINAVKPTDNNEWVRDGIFGIEKDYRLARVSKVSMFMNGAGKSNIIFGDGLDNHEQIKNEQFDILVANPPYSVSAFKSHLKLKENQLTLLDNITNNGGEIEVLFCERIAQLLKSGGIGAVILPSSILSNDSSSYIAARSLILQEFHIRAIVNLGSKTFGATGTNTVILFLEKSKYPPKAISFAKDHANAIFSKENLTAWNDGKIYQAYLSKIGVAMNDYDKLRLSTITWQEFEDLNDEYITLYKNNILPKIKFSKSQEDKLNTDEKNTIKLKSFLNQFSEIEKEKIIFFALTHEFNTLIINAPSDNAKQKIFLGYDWSNRKGAEGIQIIQAGGKLYNDTDRFATNTLASCVRMMFEKQLCQITDNHSEYAYIVNTADMLDFSLTSFNKAIRTSTQKKVEIVSKYPMVKLDAIISNIETGSRPKGGVGYISDGAYSLGGEHIGKDNGRLELKTIKYVPKEFFKNSTRGKILKNDILLCKDGALTGKVAIVKDELDGIDAMVNEHVFILRCENLTKQLYVFNYLYSEYGQLLLKNNITGSAQGGLNSTNLKNIKIPLPPLEIQEQIITECQKIDDEYENSRMEIEIYRQKIAQIFDDLDVVKNSQERERVKTFKLSNLCITNPSKNEIRNLSDDLLVSFIEMASVSNNGYIENKIDKSLGELRKGSYTYFAENDIIIAKITPCMENGKCAIAKNLTNQIGLGSSEFHVFRKNCNDVDNVFLFYYLNREKIRKNAEQNMTGASGHRRVPIGFYENLTINLPPITEQQKIVTQIESYENQITQAQAIMDSATQRKKAVLDTYL